MSFNKRSNIESQEPTNRIGGPNLAYLWRPVAARRPPDPPDPRYPNLANPPQFEVKNPSPTSVAIARAVANSLYPQDFQLHKDALYHPRFASSQNAREHFLKTLELSTRRYQVMFCLFALIPSIFREPRIYSSNEVYVMLKYHKIDSVRCVIETVSDNLLHITRGNDLHLTESFKTMNKWIGGKKQVKKSTPKSKARAASDATSVPRLNSVEFWNRKLNDDLSQTMQIVEHRHVNTNGYVVDSVESLTGNACFWNALFAYNHICNIRSDAQYYLSLKEDNLTTYGQLRETHIAYVTAVFTNPNITPYGYNVNISAILKSAYSQYLASDINGTESQIVALICIAYRILLVPKVIFVDAFDRSDMTILRMTPKQFIAEYQLTPNMEFAVADYLEAVENDRRGMCSSDSHVAYFAIQHAGLSTLAVNSFGAHFELDKPDKAQWMYWSASTIFDLDSRVISECYHDDITNYATFLAFVTSHRTRLPTQAPNSSELFEILRALDHPILLRDSTNNLTHTIKGGKHLLLCKDNHLFVPDYKNWKLYREQGLVPPYYGPEADESLAIYDDFRFPAEWVAFWTNVAQNRTLDYDHVVLHYKDSPIAQVSANPQAAFLSTSAGPSAPAWQTLSSSVPPTVPSSLTSTQMQNVSFPMDVESEAPIVKLSGHKFKINRLEAYDMEPEMLRTHYAERSQHMLANYDMNYTHVIPNSKKFLVNFEMGEATLNHFRYIMSSDAIYLSLSKTKTPYGHPLLRSVVDYYTWCCLSLLGNSTFNDIGSKIHKVLGMNPFAVVHAIRPRDNPMDCAYWDQHEAELSVSGFAGYFNPSNIANGSIAPINALCVDAMYYDGVPEGMEATLIANAEAKIFVVYMSVPNQVGRYSFITPDNIVEAYVIVTSGDGGHYYMEMFPLDNGNPYKHKHTIEFNHGLDTYCGNIHLRTVKSAKLGPNAYIVMAQATATMHCPNYPIPRMLAYCDRYHDSLVTFCKSVTAKYHNKLPVYSNAALGSIKKEFALSTDADHIYFDNTLAYAKEFIDRSMANGAEHAVLAGYESDFRLNKPPVAAVNLYKKSIFAFSNTTYSPISKFMVTLNNLAKANARANDFSIVLITICALINLATPSGIWDILGLISLMVIIMSGKTTSKFYLYYLVCKIVNASITYSFVSLALLYPICRFYTRDYHKIVALRFWMTAFWIWAFLKTYDHTVGMYAIYPNVIIDIWEYLLGYISISAVLQFTCYYMPYCTFEISYNIHAFYYSFESYIYSAYLYGTFVCVFVMLSGLIAPNSFSQRSKRYIALIIASTTPFLIPVAAYQYYGDCAEFFTLRSPYERASAWFDYFTRESLSTHDKSWHLANMVPKYKTFNGVYSTLFKCVWSPSLTITGVCVVMYQFSNSQTTVYDYVQRISSMEGITHIILAIFTVCAFFKVNKLVSCLAQTFAIYLCWELIWDSWYLEETRLMWVQMLANNRISDKYFFDMWTAPVHVLWKLTYEWPSMYRGFFNQSPRWSGVILYTNEFGNWPNHRYSLAGLAILKIFTVYYIPLLWLRSIVWPMVKWYLYLSLMVFIYSFGFGLLSGADKSIKRLFYPKKSKSAGQKRRTITPDNVESYIEKPHGLSGGGISYTWLTSLHTQKVVSNNQIMDAQLINVRGKVQTQFAETIISHVEEKKSRLEVLGIQLEQLPPMVCFGTSYLNSSWALQARHLGSRMLPDPVVVKEFLHFGQAKINSWSDRFDAFLIKSTPNIEDYLDHLPDTKKKNAYRTAYNDLLTYQRFDRKFVIEMKPEECLQGQKINGPAVTHRPRNIFNPPTWMKAIYGYVAWYMCKFLKEVYPGFIQAMRPEELEECLRIASRSFKELVMISVDGSSHDSNQDESLIKGIDHHLLKRYGGQLIKKLALGHAIEPRVIELMLDSTMQFIQRSSTMKGIIVNRGEVYGTTPSGNPTSTTLGNTLRVLLYQDFVATIANVPVLTSVSGDDVLTFIEKEHLSAFENSFWKVYSRHAPTSYTEFGLGQIAKQMDISSSNGYFLSKHVILLPDGHVVMHRQGDRMALGGNISSVRNRVVPKGQARMTQGEYNMANTLSLINAGTGLPMIESLVELRLKTIPHSFVNDKVKTALQEYPLKAYNRIEPLPQSELLNILNVGSHHVSEYDLSFEYMQQSTYRSRSLMTFDTKRSTERAILDSLKHDVETNPGPSVFTHLLVCLTLLFAAGDSSSPLNVKNLAEMQQRNQQTKSRGPPRTYVNTRRTRYQPEPMMYAPVPNRKPDRAIIRQLNDIQRQFASLKGQSFDTVATAYKQNTDGLQDAVGDLPRPDERTLRNVEHRAFMKMIDVGLKNNNMTAYESASAREKLRDLELVLLDDWSTVASIAAPHIIKYGGQAVNWLWDKFSNSGKTAAKVVKHLKPEMDKAFMSSMMDSGATKINVDRASGLTTYETVDLKTVAAYLSPEQYSSRIPNIGNQKTALAKSQFTFNVGTNSTGACGFYIFPHNTSNANSFVNFPFACIKNSGGFNPTSGDSGLDTVTYLAGPLAPTAANIRGSRTNFSSLVINPVVSTLANQGQIQMAYFQEQLNNSFVTATAQGPVLPQSILSTLRNYTISNMRVPELSMLDILHDEVVIKNQTENRAYDEGFYVLITGAAPTQTALTVTFYYTVEYLPTGDLINLVDLQYPDNGPATTQFIATILRSNPYLQSASQQYRINLATKIINAPCVDFNSLLRYVESDIGGLQAPATEHYVSSRGLDGFEDI